MTSQATMRTWVMMGVAALAKGVTEGVHVR